MKYLSFYIAYKFLRSKKNSRFKVVERKNHQSFNYINFTSSFIEKKFIKNFKLNKQNCLNYGFPRVDYLKSKNKDNNFNYLKLCINSIIKNSSFDHEIIIHINGIDKLSEDYIKENNYLYTSTPKNVGLCTGVNMAAKKSTTDYIVYAHDDMYFLPSWEENLEEEIVLLNGPILLKPLIKNNQLIRRLIYVEGFDTVTRVLFFEADLDVEVAEIGFNLGNVLGNDLILLVFLDLGEVEYLVTIFIKLTRGIADPLYLLEYYVVFYVVTLLDPIIEMISVSEKHLQLLVQVKYFLTRRASHMELLHLAIFDVICGILEH